MNKMIEEIAQVARLIGSRKWGGSTENSDYDFIADARDEEKILQITRKYNDVEQESNEYEGTSIFNEEKTVRMIKDGEKIAEVIYIFKPEISTVHKAMDRIDAYAEEHPEIMEEKFARHAVVEKFLKLTREEVVLAF